MDADAEVFAVLGAQYLDAREHVERELGEGEGVILAPVETSDDHVGVADRLDLLQPQPIEQIVERREELVQALDQLGGQRVDA